MSRFSRNHYHEIASYIRYVGQVFPPSVLSASTPSATPSPIYVIPLPLSMTPPLSSSTALCLQLRYPLIPSATPLPAGFLDCPWFRSPFGNKSLPGLPPPCTDKRNNRVRYQIKLCEHEIMGLSEYQNVRVIILLGVLYYPNIILLNHPISEYQTIGISGHPNVSLSKSQNSIIWYYHVNTAARYRNATLSH